MAKKPSCPACGSQKTMPISYGFPSPELFADAKAGKAFLGGCVIGASSPDLHCIDCGVDFLGEQLPSRVRADSEEPER